MKTLMRKMKSDKKHRHSYEGSRSSVGVYERDQTCIRHSRNKPRVLSELLYSLEQNNNKKYTSLANQ